MTAPLRPAGALHPRGQKLSLHHGRCVVNPLKKCDFLRSDGEAYHKAAALSVLLTYHKLRDNVEDDSFAKSLAAGCFLRLLSPQGAQSGGRVPLPGQRGPKGHGRPAGGGESGGGVDACAEPTANLLAALFKELAGCNEMQAAALSGSGTFWAGGLFDGRRRRPDGGPGGRRFQPLYPRLGLSGKKCSPQRSARRRMRP